MNKNEQKATPPEAEFDGYRDTYSDDINDVLSFSGQSHDFFTKVKADYLLKLAGEEQQGKAPLKVLDVGCGHGLIHPYLYNQTDVPLELTGIDVAATVIDVARKDHPSISYDTYEGTRLPYEDNSFDMGFSICTMHHVPPAQWQSFLAELKRVVRPGGVVTIFEHNPYNPLTLYVVNSCPIDDDAVLLRPGKLKSLFQVNEFNDIKTDFILFTPFATGFFRQMDKALKWLPLGAQYFTFGRV